MKQNSKGFTLIELLAVIVILAIIALIATPIVINVINKARKSAAEDSTYGILNAAELYYTTDLFEHPEGMTSDIIWNFGTATAPEISAGDSEKGLTFKGTRPTAGKVKLTTQGVVTIEEPLKFGAYNCSLTADGKASCS